MARTPASARLSFTPEVTIRTSGATLETAGIRPMKYAFDFAVTGQRNNDWVVFRYADVILMQAEAMLRGGNGGAPEALKLVNGLREKRGVSAFPTLDLDNLLDERARELYWEGRSEEHTSELQSRENLVCRLLLDKESVIRLTVHAHGVVGD